MLNRVEEGCSYESVDDEQNPGAEVAKAELFVVILALEWASIQYSSGWLQYTFGTHPTGGAWPMVEAEAILARESRRAEWPAASI